MRVIPIEREDWMHSLPRQVTPPTDQSDYPVLDQLGRPLRDLRISVTDRCNFRCSYCMPKSVYGRNHRFLPTSELLSFEEIALVARQFVELGVRKIRLTGGEPLLRKNLEHLIELLASIPVPNGEELDLTLTTNGSLLAKKARGLRNAGLKRVTVSLDALDDRTFRKMNDVDYPVQSVLEGISAAQAVGFSSVKVNMVVKRGTNDHEILPMAQFFRGSGTTLRFIEYMDVGSTNGWRMDEVLPGSTVVNLIQQAFPLIQLEPCSAGETAERWGYVDSTGRHDPKLGEVGVICSVTQAFCGDCNRARLSTEGRLFLCLFSGRGIDLKSIIRDGTDLREIRLNRVVQSAWNQRTDQYSKLRAAIGFQTNFPGIPKPEMSYLGG